MNRFTSSTLKALAPAGSHTAQYVSTQRRAEQRQVEHGEEQRHQHDDAGDEQRGQHRRGHDLGVAGPQHRQHEAAGRGHDQLHDPRAQRDPQRVAEVLADLDLGPGRSTGSPSRRRWATGRAACAACPASVLVAALASHRIGPMPATQQQHEGHAVRRPASTQRRPGLPPVVRREDPALAAVAGLGADAASPPARRRTRRLAADVRRGVDAVARRRVELVGPHGRAHVVLHDAGEPEVHGRQHRRGTAPAAATARSPPRSRRSGRRSRRSAARTVVVGVLRAAAGHQERLGEHLERGDDLQDQRDQQDVAHLRQRDVPDLAPQRRRRRPRRRRTARSGCR